MNRVLPAFSVDYNSTPFYPEQAIPLEVALAAYTSGSAWATHDAGAGRLAAGMRADICVTDRNPFTRDSAEIGDVKTAATMFGGDLVFNTF